MLKQKLVDQFVLFFASPPRNHKLIPSSPLVPDNDPTVLFITAGMHPLVPYLLGELHPLGKRLVDVQKSMRTDDIEEVGDLRHFTFFQMLGNWSFGDYFKKEAISWSFDFLTSSKWLNFDPHKIYVSVFKGDKDAPTDKESIRLWQEAFKKAGIDAYVGNPNNGITKNDRIFPYPKDKNWWGPAGKTGPCGPDTEMFYDTGLPLHKIEIHGPHCHPNCDCGRYIEVWNDVFMEFNKLESGNYVPLQQKNVDTGMGVERVTAIMEWVKHIIPYPDPYLTSLFKNSIKYLEKSSRKKYEEPNYKLFRIISDHTRAAVFLLADGVLPSNKERGYVLRKLIRRAIRFSLLLGIDHNFLKPLSEIIINDYKHDYPELITNQLIILKELENEDSKFRNTLKKGLTELTKYSVLTGKIAFDLYQSYGFPWEMTAEIAHEKGQKIEKKIFEEEFQKHQELSRTATKGTFKGGLQDHTAKTTRLHTATHLLQQSLRSILGNHVRQKGSNITNERLRFDFYHDKKLTSEEIDKIEKLVNLKISENLPVTMKITDFREALSQNALTVPGTNYPDKVKVYSIDNFSKEVCGGPHVDFTGTMGKFKINKEEAAGNQIRRIYATLTD